MEQKKNLWNNFLKWEMFSLTDNGDNPNILEAKLLKMNYYLVFNKYPLILITQRNINKCMYYKKKNLLINSLK